MATQAPGSLGLVQDFVNTLEMEPGPREADVELLGTPEALAAWLRERDLLHGGAASEPDLARAVELREAIRRLLLANNGGPVQEADLAVLDRVAVQSGLRPRFVTAGRVVLEPTADGVGGALG